jgi:hypothetical protein
MIEGLRGKLRCRSYRPIEGAAAGSTRDGGRSPRLSGDDPDRPALGDPAGHWHRHQADRGAGRPVRRALVFFEYNAVYPSLIEFRDGAPYNRIRYLMMLTIVLPVGHRRGPRRSDHGLPVFSMPSG